MARRFTYIPPSTFEPFLKVHEGLKLCNTCKTLRSHFLSTVISANSWSSYDCLHFGLQFCEYVTRMRYFCNATRWNLSPTHFPRLQKLTLHLATTETLPDMSVFMLLRWLDVSQFETLNVNPEFLPKNLTTLSLSTDVIFLKDKHWPCSLTSFYSYGNVVLDQWPPNLEKLSMSNTGRKLCMEKPLRLPSSLPSSVTSLHLGSCFFWILDPSGFVPNSITHLTIGCGLYSGDEKRDEWISKCDHTTHFETDIKFGPLILPPNVQHVYLRNYLNALNVDQLPLTIHSLKITEIQHYLAKKSRENE